MPTTLSKPAALLRLNLESAPFGVSAVVVGTTDAMGEAEEPVADVLVAEPPVAFAAAWNAWNVFVAVGFTAKTIPFAQCLISTVIQFNHKQCRGCERAGSPGLGTEEPERC